MKMRNIFSAAVLSASLLSSNAFASSVAPDVFSSSSSLQNFTLGNIDARSYDGAGFDSIGSIGKVTPLNFLEFSSFTAQPNGVQYEIFLLSSVAGYRDHNEFGLMRDDGTFASSVKASSALGSSTTYTQQPNEKLQFGFKSPEGTFYTDAAKNADGQVHVLGFLATQNALLTIPRADLQGNGFSFNLQTGDFIFAWEDCKQYSIACGFFGPANSDFDYNDAVYVVRAKPIPEPATMLLLGAGSLVAFRRRKALVA